MTTEDTNAAYEQDMRDCGHDKWTLKHQSQEDTTDSPHHFNKLKQALPKVAEGLAQALKQNKRSKEGFGSQSTWVKELAQVDVDTLAYIGLLCSFNGVLKVKTITQVTQDIGELIEKELLKRDLMLDDKAQHKAAVEAAEQLGLERPRPRNRNKRLVDQVSEAHTSPKYRIKSLRIIAEKNGVRSLNFGTANTRAERQRMKERRTKLAAPVLSTVLEFSDVFVKLLQVDGLTSRALLLQFTPEAEEQLAKDERYLSWMAPVYKPMLAEPKPWVDFGN